MTVFDDEPIAIENLGKPEEIKAETDEENVKKSETDKEAVEENETDKENVGIKENEKSEKSTESEADQELQEETVENESKEVSEATKEEIEQAEKPELSEENINPDIPEHVKAEPEITSEEMQEEIFSKEVAEERPKETDEEIPQKETAGKSENENEIRSAETENKCQGCEPGTDTRWNRATARYIHFQPVQDEKIEDAIRIQPSDLKILWQKGLRQGSNSFLMHGYYQHQHLMIGKSKEGGYILGIPGFYGEKNMAEMFGFPEFRRAKAERTSEIKEQTFGYWCKNLI